MSPERRGLGQMLPSQAFTALRVCVCDSNKIKKKRVRCGAKRCMRRRNVTRGKENVNAWNRWPTDQALPLHAPRAAPTTQSVRECDDAAGRRARARLTRRTRLCKGGHVRRLFYTQLSLRRHEAALSSPGVRSAAVRQGRKVKGAN